MWKNKVDFLETKAIFFRKKRQNLIDDEKEYIIFGLFDCRYTINGTDDE